MKYEKAKAEVVLFDNSDVVTTSGEFTGNCPHTEHIASGCDHGNHNNQQN